MLTVFSLISAKQVGYFTPINSATTGCRIGALARNTASKSDQARRKKA